MNYAAIIDSPIGKIGIQLSPDFANISNVDFLDKKQSLQSPTHSLAKKAVAELEHYFNYPHTQFSVPLQAVGTQLQQQIWQAMQKIPVGKTLTYSDLATKLNTSPRVVGNACRANPIPLFIPCHRILGKSNLGGFSGAITGEPMIRKIWLLQHETMTK